MIREKGKQHIVMKHHQQQQCFASVQRSASGSDLQVGYITVTFKTFSSKLSTFVRVLVDLGLAAGRRAGGQGQLISLSSLRAAEACLQVYGVTEDLGSAHITPHHSISSCSSCSSSSIHLCPPHSPSPPRSLFPTATGCSVWAFTVKYSPRLSLSLCLSLSLFLSCLPPSAFLHSFLFSLPEGGRDVNGALSSKLVFSPPLHLHLHLHLHPHLLPPYLSFSQGKYCTKGLWARATEPRHI